MSPNFAQNLSEFKGIKAIIFSLKTSEINDFLISLEVVYRSELIEFLLKFQGNFGDGFLLFQIMNRRQILLLIITEFKRIN